MSDKELIALLKETNHQVDILDVLNKTIADDHTAKKHLEDIKEKKKQIILSNMRMILREKPAIYQKCFPSHLNVIPEN